MQTRRRARTPSRTWTRKNRTPHVRFPDPVHRNLPKKLYRKTPRAPRAPLDEE